MKKYIGVWVDHEKAFVASIIKDEEMKKETIIRIESKVEGRVRLSGGSRYATPYGPQDVVYEKSIEERRKHHLRQYHQRIVQAIRDGQKIFIFGPGEAKLELEKEIRKSKELAGKLVGVEAADKMTERQIAAKVRRYFFPDL
ncbi:MAG: hypothetical protein JSV50_18970 [Desulfobacteraceae bacterium]|nr:MAG: hypothetical protein JSV50_18970 [Desulfobacteraceae bacterium]